MPTVLDLQNAQLWQLLYVSGVYQVVHVGNGWVPIPPFYLPIICTHHTLMVSAESQLAKAEWWLGIRLQMIIDAPGTDFGEIPAQSINVPINRPFLVQFSDLSDSYRLRVEVPPWHEEMSIRIWQYIGITSDSTEDLIISTAAGIEQDLARIESKIDNLG